MVANQPARKLVEPRVVKRDGNPNQHQEKHEEANECVHGLPAPQFGQCTGAQWEASDLKPQNQQKNEAVIAPPPEAQQ